MEEIWKDVAGYEGLYQVSNMGRVKSLDRRVEYGKRGAITFRKGAIMSSYVSGTGEGYKRVKLAKGSAKNEFMIHRLVAMAFIPNPGNKPCVNHIDGNKHNNRADNLEWCTHSENMKHAYRTGLSTPNYHFRHSESAKRTISEKNMWGHSRKNRVISQFSLSGEFIRNWNGFCEIKKELGYNSSNILACCSGKYKQSHGYIWRYADGGSTGEWRNDERENRNHDSADACDDSGA